MSRRTTPAAYKKAFLARTKAVREAAGLTQEQVANRLGLAGRDYYSIYERRTMLPHEYIAPFADLCRTSCHFLLTGKHLDTLAQRPFVRTRTQP